MMEYIVICLSSIFEQIPIVTELPVGLNYQDHSSAFRNVFFENPQVPKEEHLYKANLSSTKSLMEYCPLTTAAGQAFSFFDVDKEGNYFLSNKMPEIQIFMIGGPFIVDPDDEVLSRFNEFANFGPLLVRRDLRIFC